MMPRQRFRRLRSTAARRLWVKETTITPAQLIMPYFVVPGRNVRRPIASMPGQYQLSIDQLLLDVQRLPSLGILSILLFGVPDKKDPKGTDAYSPRGVIQEAVCAVKKNLPDLIVITDLCFCEYTTHGHCGIIKKSRQGKWDVDNDATLAIMQRAAVAQAQAGADFVAPSGMMDGAVAAIRIALDKKKFSDVGIIAYSAKYASVFYGPFRDAAGSAPQFGHRQGYQMDPSNAREGVKEILADVQEGADMVMVKPALSYLDVIGKIRPEVKVPLVAYNVSGEYAVVKAAEKMGWVDNRQERLAMEILTSIKRAGADLIITYHAVEVAKILKQS